MNSTRNLEYSSQEKRAFFKLFPQTLFLFILTLESGDVLVSYVPGSCFTVSVNLQAHVTAFRAKLIQEAA